ncbi:MAG: sterol desaturase family protein [Bacteroidota bacterium]
MQQAANYIALAIPVFFLLIGIELLIGKLKQTKLYRFNDAVTNISCGIGQQVLAVFLKTILAVGYVYLWSHHRWMDLAADQWWVWVICFFGVDFFYYWFHRYAHEVSVMWGGHIVHHQSEEYNLSVALRQGAFQSSFSWAFYLPLAIIGFDPFVFIIVNQFQTLYQFWIHTKAIQKLHPWFEFVFNTPSHHRVHHGVNPKYIDKNHGGTLIIWDRMFGTFAAEEEEPVYGVTKALKSWNPVWANFDYYVDVFRLAFKTKTIGDFFRVFTREPGWRPDYLGGPLTPQEVSEQTRPKYDTAVPSGLNYYVLFQYVVLLVVVSGFLFGAARFDEFFEGGWANFWRFSIAGLIFLGIASLGGLLEKKRWAGIVESGRLLLLVGAGAALSYGGPYFVAVLAGVGAYALLSLAWCWRFNSSAHVPAT